ncbi:MAG: class II D-tagatose-bisphosphate aldolase non-catalytic subunit [Pleomorphochaeta sp.]
MNNAINELVNICKSNINGNKAIGICSVCSSHSGVLDASIKQSKEDNSPLLIESTSNQVDQFGGYTGMKPIDFMNYVKAKAEKFGYPTSKLIFGGDHLGPNRWQNENSDVAMEKACELVKTYVKAGYRKIHLDASMPLKDDNGHVDEITVAKRAAQLCKSAEEAWQPLSKKDCRPYYVIGTEVPTPGGIQQSEGKIKPTPAYETENTRNITKKIFDEYNLSDAWNRVIAMVVQPGVEYANNWVSDLESSALLELNKEAEKYGNLVYEAHSTDYQSESALTNLVQNHFVILKVGPWVSFAYREGLYALEMIEQEVFKNSNVQLSNLKNTVESVMLKDDSYWKKYCDGKTENEKYLQRHFGLSDRIRYYWTNKEIIKAQNLLFSNLENNPFENDKGLISQFLPSLMDKFNENKLSFTRPNEIAEECVRIVLKKYHRASGFIC